jgi:hypothetical protein
MPGSLREPTNAQPTGSGMIRKRDHFRGVNVFSLIKKNIKVFSLGDDEFSKSTDSDGNPNR